MIRENDPWIRSTISIGFECDSPIQYLLDWKMCIEHFTWKRRLKSEITYYNHARQMANGLIGMRIDFMANFDIEIRISQELV